jgi:hypothetical protein
VRRVAASIVILVGAALTLGGAALVFSEPRRELVLEGAGAILLGLAILVGGIALKPRRRERRAREWPLSPRS